MNEHKNNQVFPKPAINELKQQLSGFVFQPLDAAYSELVSIDNGRVQLRPLMIIMASDTRDISLAIRFARQHQLQLTSKGGGHSAAGYCINDGGMVLDLSLMNSIALDRERSTIRVQMGARWNDVYLYLMSTGTGLIPIGGGCPTVGIPGFIQGGGYSFVSRSYGMSIDNLLSLTIVTADGEVRTLSESASSKYEQDLFWACRGGGGGNFGVAVEMELRVHKPRTPEMFTAQIRYRSECAEDVLGFYNDWVENEPKELAMYGIWANQADPADSLKMLNVFGFTAVFNGLSSEGLDRIAPILKAGKLLSAQFNNFTLPEFEEVNGRSTLVKGRSAYIRSGMMPPKAMNKKAVGILQKYMSTAPSAASFLVWTHAGGQIESVDSKATAFPHRSARFVPELKAIWENPRDGRRNIEWAYAFFRELEPHFTGAYVNYIDPLLPQWKKKYYDENYDRLLKAKRDCDPDDFFHFQQGVNSDFEPKITEPLDLSPLNRT